MKRIRILKVLFLFGFVATVLVFDSASWSADTPTGDLTQNIDVYAANGILKFHGRNETQFRDLRQGTASLTSGAFLKTGNGPANILFANDSVLCLDANTEVQVGLYENGIWICQYSGRAYHSHEPGENNLHIVQTSLYAVRALGTDYRTTVNSPVEGAVTIEWGKVGVIFPREIIGGIDGPVVPEVRAFVPSGRKIVPPIHEDIITTDPNTRIYRPAQSDKVIKGEKVVRQPRDEWERSRRNLGRQILEIRRRRGIGTLSPEDYRMKLGSLLGIDPAIIPGRPLPRLGGLWIGGGDVFIIKMCIQGNTISRLQIVDYWDGTDKETHEHFQHYVNFGFPQGTQFSIGPGGQVYDGATIGDENGIWKGATVVMSGHIGERTGHLFVTVYSETDVAIYSGFCGQIEIHLVDPNGCNY